MRAMQYAVVGLIVLVSLGLIFTVMQWKLPPIIPNPNPDPNQKEWVNFQPKTCQEIPWRKAWSEANEKPYEDFPLEDELAILKQYYTSKNVTISEAKILYTSSASNPNACTGCGCEEPFSFEVYVSQSDAALLAISGFTLSKQGIVNDVLGS